MKTSLLNKSLVALALVTLCAPLAVQAGAIDAEKVSKVHVQVNDLNLSNAAGVDVLYQRLSNASRAVCGSYSDLKIVGSLKQLRLNKECFDSTLADALADANFSKLAQATGFSIRSQG